MAQTILILLFAIGWVIFQMVEGISKSDAQSKLRRTFKAERNKKYRARIIDRSKTLFERNLDIIDSFESLATVRASYRSYQLENGIRDCINEICLAEDQIALSPGSSYLSNWKPKAPADWKELASSLESYFREKKRQADALQLEISREALILQSAIARRKDPDTFRLIVKTIHPTKSLTISDISEILNSNPNDWTATEHSLTTEMGIEQDIPLLKSTTSSKAVDQLNHQISLHNSELDRDRTKQASNNIFFKNIREGYYRNEKNFVIERLSFILNYIDFPSSIPKNWEIDYDAEQQIAIVEWQLPDIVHSTVLKDVNQKNGIVQKPLTIRETKDIVPQFQPAIMLRIAYEIFKNDNAEIIKLLVVNGWIEFFDPKTGNTKKEYVSSLMVERHQVVELNLSKLDAVTAFSNLKGKSAGKLVDIVPIVPIISLNREDRRFIETKEVLDRLGNETNLASMDWQDFESLIAELFHKEFAKDGVEVKVTQASRDRGVDAIVFDPDPIRGGKFVIQAKRYTNTVDVSAVRDLCAVVKKEGASRGILVTTSHYGSDAYAFANNEPITLLNGSELLGLLAKHGYKFRINLAEAKQMLAAQLEE